MIFEAHNTDMVFQTAATLNLIDDDTEPAIILDYIDQILHRVVELREGASLGIGVPRMRNSENGRLQTLWLLNAARSSYQTVSHDYDALEADGFERLSPQKSAYHAIGLDPARVEKWVHPDGREYVFLRDDRGGASLALDGRNNGTFNYCALPACHMVLDVLPWVKWGATLSDPSTPEERAVLFRESLLLANYSWEDLLGFF